jgi:hypothetical protein
MPSAGDPSTFINRACFGGRLARGCSAADRGQRVCQRRSRASRTLGAGVDGACADNSAMTFGSLPQATGLQPGR